MSVIEFIILGLALSFEILIVMNSCAKAMPVRLTKGLAESFSIALINALMLLLGIWIGNMLRFTPENIDPNAPSTNNLLAETDNLVYLGLLILVAVRLLMRSGKKNRKVQPYDISKFGTVALLGIAVGINIFLVGFALGFRIPLQENIWRASIPMVVIMTLFAFLGIMLGRQNKELRARRYTLIAVLLLLAFALKILWE